jgi:ATP-dependent helicase Lhr and Lhr-like helicase
MTAVLDPQLVGNVLSALEDRELPLLSWGVTSGVLSRDEVVQILREHLALSATAPEPEDLLEFLTSKALLLQVPGSSPPRYRTRLAETVRLTADLRQLFPPRDLRSPPQRWWDQGRPLIADYRLHVAPRRYPRRDIPAPAALASLQMLNGWSPLHSAIAAAQLEGRQLARFQLDAARSVFSSLVGRQHRGVIVGAGTGSGKTMAFYLPAYAAMASRIQAGQFGVQTLALYPRKELLRDQVREAVRAAGVIRAALVEQGRRPLRIGALYGDTPGTAVDQRLRPGQDLHRVWRSRSDGLVCPYFPCPLCASDLLWPEGDRLQQRDMLKCTSCSFALGADDIALTRESLIRQPPDLLFTTTEMLNQRASDYRLGRLMGWLGRTTPRLVLLDEVHTYAGMHGAQVGLLLRRWRNAVRTPVTFVGLSATLRDAAGFFARLIGVTETAVDSITVTPEDLISQGREYALAVRGDPISGASLLSTSIQAAMLHGRALDRKGAEYLYGSTGFLFTDDLDVTNRFYDDLRDAEGKQHRSRRGRLQGKVLAGLRSPDAPFASQRYRDGQSWDLVHGIGRPLPPLADSGELRIGRTSSQDAGVDLDADLIVATASLEVGFNDARVGLVLQHKAPHDMAAFIQRRGRAGRLPQQRPWTVVALSDYGRDRLTYQSYDSLFSPQVPARNLPVGNRSVLKIQGTQALLDWMGRKLFMAGVRLDPRRVLRAPRDRQRTNLAEQQRVADLLEDLLRETVLQDDLATHLQHALGVDPDEVQALLWEPPRALLLAVVPTALRRLRSAWRPAVTDPGAQPGDLLPEFITRALFDSLNVPEVRLQLPLDDADDEHMPIAAALREAVPGRVSRRFGYRRDEHRTWLPLPGQDGKIELRQFVTAGSRQGQWHPHDASPVEVVRPFSMQLAIPSADVADSAQGMPRWASQLVEPDADLVAGDVPRPSPWSTRVPAVHFATHAAGNPIQVRRMTLGARCDTRYQDGRAETRTAQYVIDGAPGALGFSLTVDAMRFQLMPLNHSDDRIRAYLSSPSWRTLAFTIGIAEDPALEDVANTFQRGWLSLVYLTAFALAGIDGSRTPADIHASLAGGAWRTGLRRVLAVMYRDADPDGHLSPAPERLLTTLEELSHDPRVTACLDRHGDLLMAPDLRASTGALAQRAYRDTLAAGILAAALRACPDAQERDLIVDVVPGANEGAPATIWLSETALGGIGIVEQLVQYYARDPRRFWGLVEAALGPGDYEDVDGRLVRLLDHLQDAPTGAAANAIGRLRAAASAADADTALRDLLEAWTVLDGPPRHAAVAGLSARLLRPGSTKATDNLAYGLIQAWDDLERRLGIELDARVIAYAVGAGELAIAGTTTRLTVDQVFSLLWPRGLQARSQHLQHYQPFSPPPVLDRLLVSAAHDQGLPRLDVTTTSWQSQYQSLIAKHGAIDLTAPADQSAALSSAIRTVPALPIDLDVLRVYGSAQQFTRTGNRIAVRVELREKTQ